MAIVLAIPLPKQTKETSWTFENDFCYYTDENKHFKLVCFNNLLCIIVFLPLISNRTHVFQPLSV